MKLLRGISIAWLALVGWSCLLWILTGIWVLHTPENFDQAGLMFIGMLMASVVATAFLVVET